MAETASTSKSYRFQKIASELRNKQSESKIAKLEKRLKKAREIIEEFMITETGEIGYSKLYDKAERFLKEIEK